MSKVHCQRFEAWELAKLTVTLALHNPNLRHSDLAVHSDRSLSNIEDFGGLRNVWVWNTQVPSPRRPSYCALLSGYIYVWRWSLQSIARCFAHHKNALLYVWTSIESNGKRVFAGQLLSLMLKLHQSPCIPPVVVWFLLVSLVPNQVIGLGFWFAWQLNIHQWISLRLCLTSFRLSL